MTLRRLDFQAPTGLLLVGHGTRNQQGTDEFFQLASIVAQRASPLSVEACFLELCKPTLAEGWQRLCKQGARHIRVAPVLLWAAGHALRDVPDAIKQLSLATPGVTFDQADVLGFHPAILRRSQSLARSTMDPIVSWDARRSALVMVGRGSTESTAIDEMIRFGELRGQQQPFGRVEVGFVAMALPTLGSVLDEVASDRSIRDVIVQPHLLFAGDLECTVCKMVRRSAMRAPHLRWHITGLLGPNADVADAILDRSGLIPNSR